MAETRGAENDSTRTPRRRYPVRRAERCGQPERYAANVGGWAAILPAAAACTRGDTRASSLHNAAAQRHPRVPCRRDPPPCARARTARARAITTTLPVDDVHVATFVEQHDRQAHTTSTAPPRDTVYTGPSLPRSRARASVGRSTPPRHPGERWCHPEVPQQVSTAPPRPFHRPPDHRGQQRPDRDRSDQARDPLVSSTRSSASTTR